MACFRLFSADGKFIGTYADPLQAALRAAALGHGTTIRDGLFRKDVLWTEGSERQAAAASPDYVIATLMQRRAVRRTSQKLAGARRASFTAAEEAEPAQK